MDNGGNAAVAADDCFEVASDRPRFGLEALTVEEDDAFLIDFLFADEGDEAEDVEPDTTTHSSSSESAITITSSLFSTKLTPALLALTSAAE
jgi:hypothetical protein